MSNPTLQEIAVTWLPVLAQFKPDPLKVPMDLAVRLSTLADQIEKHGKEEMCQKLTVLMLATMPVPELPAPAGTEKVAAWLVQSLEGEMRSWLE